VVQTPSALYQMGKAGVLAAETLPGVPGKGSLKPAKALGDGLLNESVIGNLLQGKFDKAGKLAVDHPGYAAMELWGGKGAVGRSAGAAARVAGKVGKEGNVLERAGSTARAPKRAYGNVEKTRHYDKDLINKGAQVVAERIQRSRGKDPNAMGAGEAKRYVKKRVAAIGQMNEVLRRTGRQTAKNVMHDAAPGKRRIREPKHSDLLGLMAQKVVRSPETLRPDLENFRAALVDARHGLEPHELKLNESLVKSIEKALGDREFMANPGQWFDAANEYVKARFSADQDLKKLGLLTDGQESAKQLPALMAHLGDRFTHEPHRRETTLHGERVEVIKAELADRQAELRAVESKLANRKLRERGQRRANEALERRGKALPGDENVTRLRGEVRELERELARTQHAAKKQHRQTGRLEGVAEERVKGTSRRLSAKAAEALARQEKVLDGDTPAKVNRAHSRLSATVKLHEDSALRAADAGDEAGFSSFADLLSKAQGRKRPVDRKKAAVDRAEAATEKAANPEARHGCPAGPRRRGHGEGRQGRRRRQGPARPRALQAARARRRAQRGRPRHPEGARAPRGPAARDRRTRGRARAPGRRGRRAPQGAEGRQGPGQVQPSLLPRRRGRLRCERQAPAEGPRHRPRRHRVPLPQRQEPRLERLPQDLGRAPGRGQRPTHGRDVQARRRGLLVAGDDR
jgi:hypothetical protein